MRYRCRRRGGLLAVADESSAAMATPRRSDLERRLRLRRRCRGRWPVAAVAGRQYERARQHGGEQEQGTHVDGVHGISPRMTMKAGGEQAPACSPGRRSILAATHRGALAVAVVDARA